MSPRKTTTKEGIYCRNGIYGIRYSIQRPDGQRHQKRESLGRGASMKDAEALLRQRLTERDHGIIGNGSTLTLGYYIAEWIRLGASDRSDTTNDRYRQYLRNQIGPGIGDVKLAKLKPLQVRGFLEWAREHGRCDGKSGGLASKTVKHLHTLLHAALEQAVVDQVIPINPVHAVKSPKVPKPDIHTAEDDDLARLLTAIAHSYWRIPILLVLSTGMRRGELCGLKWGDFDSENRTLTIQRALIHTEAKGVQEKGTKTDRDRTILLPADTTEALLLHKEEQGSNPGDWICLNTKGGRLAPKSIDKAYRSLRQSVGVSIRLHELRHTWATRQLMAGVPDDVVAKMLGHATTATLHNFYSHPVLKHQQETLAVTEDMLRQKPSIRIIKG